MIINGLLLIDKPINWTSFDVVAKVRGILKLQTGQKIKVGHSGTLDPLATGLLVVAVGSHTKRLPELIKQDKTYAMTICFGSKSTTGDEEGEKIYVSGNRPTSKQLLQTLEVFAGDIEQIPPRFSAIKINGQRAYDLARNGKQFKLEPRKVKINSLKLVNYNYPVASVMASVSSGTYMRSLAEDIGDNLGCGAYVKSLRRTIVGQLKVDDALAMDNLSYSQIIEHLFTLDK